jgi:hypothetical protein
MFQASTYIVFRNIAMRYPVICSFKEGGSIHRKRSVTLRQYILKLDKLNNLHDNSNCPLTKKPTAYFSDEARKVVKQLYVILVAVSIMKPFLPKVYVNLRVGIIVPDIFLMIKCLMVMSADQVNAKFMEPSAK